MTDRDSGRIVLPAWLWQGLKLVAGLAIVTIGGWVGAQLAAHEKRIGEHDVKIERSSTRLDAIETGLDKIDAKLDRVLERVK